MDENDGPGDGALSTVRSWLATTVPRRRGGSRQRADRAEHPQVRHDPTIEGVETAEEGSRSVARGSHGEVAPLLEAPTDTVTDRLPGDIRQARASRHAHEAERMHALYTATTCGHVILNRVGELVGANAAAQRILGVRLDEMRGQPSSIALWRAIHADGLNPREGENLVKVAWRTRRPQRADAVRVTRPDGQRRWLQVDVVPVVEDGAGTRQAGEELVGVSFIDITAHRDATEVLRARAAGMVLQQAAATVLAAAATIPDAVSDVLRTLCERGGWDTGFFWSVDHHENVLRCDALWPRPQAEDPEQTLQPQRPHAIRAAGVGIPGRVWASGEVAWMAALGTTSPGHRASMATTEGLYGVIGIPVVIGGAVHGVIEFVGRDIRPPHADLVQSLSTIGVQIGRFMERTRAEEVLRRQALHDDLTDLPNRTLLHDRLEQALRVANRDNVSLALLLIDLNRFKMVNDTLGHHYGDLLLREVGTRLRGALRERDTVARLGGDEFVALLPGDEQTGATRTARKLLAALEAPVLVEGHRFVVGASIGVSVYPAHGADAPTLLRRADDAMYVAKHAAAPGGSAFSVYAAAREEHSPDRLTLGEALSRAIARDELALHYQPAVDFMTGDVRRVEALVHWARLEDLLPSAQVVPLAEQTHLGASLARWTLETALRQCQRWQWAGLPLGVAVNLSRSALHDPRLPDTIVGLLARYAARPSWLRIEVAEDIVMSMSMKDGAGVLDALTRLHRLGIRISVDAVGTGHASLASLARLPIDELKIDASVVRQLTESHSSVAKISSTIDLGHTLGLRVVAEGIESEDTWDLLVGLGCDEAQGDYLSRPLRAGELVRQFGASPGAVAQANAPGERAPVIYS